MKSSWKQCIWRIFSCLRLGCNVCSIFCKQKQPHRTSSSGQLRIWSIFSNRQIRSRIKQRILNKCLCYHKMYNYRYIWSIQRTLRNTRLCRFRICLSLLLCSFQSTKNRIYLWLNQSFLHISHKQLLNHLPYNLNSYQLKQSTLIQHFQEQYYSLTQQFYGNCFLFRSNFRPCHILSRPFHFNCYICIFCIPQCLQRSPIKTHLSLNSITCQENYEIIKIINNSLNNIRTTNSILQKTRKQNIIL